MHLVIRKTTATDVLTMHHTDKIVCTSVDIIQQGWYGGNVVERAQAVVHPVMKWENRFWIVNNL